MNNKTKYLILIIAVTLVTLISSSYALLRNSSRGTNTYTMNVGNLEVNFVDQNTSDIQISNMYPMSDEEGLALNGEHDILTFTIFNNGSMKANYDVYIDELDTSDNIKSGIKFAYSTDNGVNYSIPKLAGTDNYIEKNGIIESTETKTYKVKMWLDENVNSTYMNKTFRARIVVESKQVSNLANDLIRKVGVETNYFKSYSANFPSFDTQDKYLDTYDKQDVYYFNGTDAKNNGNVLFAGYCWQIVRTTDTGGVKLLYNGVAENNQCSDDRTGKKGINSASAYGNITGLGTTSVYGMGFTYDANGFTLTGVMTGKSWATDSESLIGTYTCKETNTTCETISYIGRYVNTTTGYGSTYQIGDLLDKYTVGISPFSPNYDTAAGVGYMYNKMYFRNDGTKTGDYGTTATWNGSSYTLSSTANQTAPSVSKRYVCDTDCTKVRYYYYAKDSDTTYRYVLLENGKSVNDLLYEMLNYKTQADIYNNKADATLNVYSSAIKRYLESWYNQNIKSYESLIDKSTVYCNDRTITTIGSWDPASSDTTSYLHFKNVTANTGDLRCGNIRDRFSMENVGAKIDAPIGLLTEPERHLMGAAYAGDGVMNGESMTYYWGLSPRSFNLNVADVRLVGASGAADGDAARKVYGVRPAVTLSADAEFSEGNGSKTTPYVVGEKIANRTIS